VTGNVGEYRERLLDFISFQGIQLDFKESIAPAPRMSFGGRIAVLPGEGAVGSSARLFISSRMRCYIRPSGASLPARQSARQKPRLSRSSKARPSASTLVEHR
jgi:hypothetical protein